MLSNQTGELESVMKTDHDDQVYIVYRLNCARVNLPSGFLTRSDTNQALQPQKMVRGLKFQIMEVEVLYLLWGENKGTDQLRAHHAAELGLCF